METTANKPASVADAKPRRVEEGVAARPAEQTRLDSVDLLRGLVMIFMELDHVRWPYFTNAPFGPENIERTYLALFLTRWITHYCAPLFFLLAGTGATLTQAQTPPNAYRTAIRDNQNPRTLSPAEKKALLEAREAVWRAYFTNDQAQLDKLVPEDTIVLEGPFEKPFVKKAEILEFAKQSAQGGSKLVRLEFPQTEMQVYGDTAIIYTTYLYELENARGGRHISKGRATEIFVRRKGAWVNPGWHTTPDTANEQAASSTGANDGRDADRAEIRAHIESIFQAFIDKDAAKLRATHLEDWRGFLEGFRVAVRGVEEYMQAVSGGIKGPKNTGLKAYQITDYDVIFHGADMAVVCFVADVQNWSGRSDTLRIMDVYAKRNGAWIQAASHTVRMPR